MRLERHFVKTLACHVTPSLRILVRWCLNHLELSKGVVRWPCHTGLNGWSAIGERSIGVGVEVAGYDIFKKCQRSA